MTIQDHIQKARLDLVDSRTKYREVQVEAWGMCSQLLDALKPGNPDSDQPVLTDDQIREVTILLDHLRSHANTVRHNANWLRNCQLIAAKQMEEDAS